jgi:hypothetical protein
MALVGSGSSFCISNTNDTGIKYATAPSMSDLWDTVETTYDAQVTNNAHKFSKILEKLKFSSEGKDIEKLLSICKIYTELNPQVMGGDIDIGGFIRIAESAILERVDFVDEKTNIQSHAGFVKKIARRGHRKPRTKVFTTNYDLCFEYAARQHRFVVVDGFSHFLPQVYDRGYFSYDIVRREAGKDNPDYIENVFHLYKLHGSRDWVRRKGNIYRGITQEKGDLPVLIYPRASKYQESFEAPYLDMMGAFQAGLREPDTTLFVSGFSFFDSHIAAPVLAAIEANLSLRLIICDNAFLIDNAELEKDEPVPPANVNSKLSDFLKKIISFVNADDQRILLINGRFEDMVEGLPDLTAQTERERHAERVRRLRDAGV